jgi:hypothetical protein
MSPRMCRPSRCWLLLMVCFSVLAGCERKQRARERDAIEAEAKARTEAERRARRAAEPLPEEPPVELLRVPGSGLPCEVDEVFAAKCRRCHTVPTRHGAPFVFLTWQDTQQLHGGQPLTSLIGRAVRSGFMPYRIEANPKVQPLTDREKEIILAWIDAGAPKQDCDPAKPQGLVTSAKQTKAGSKPRATPSARADAPAAARREAPAAAD